MVQNFLVEEVTELIHDNEKLEDWKQKCKELGLLSQLQLASQDKSPILFDSMNELQFRVYRTLCPANVNYRDYNRTAIPLEVLSLFALCEKEAYFQKMNIWYDDKNPDPIAVGLPHGKSEWSSGSWNIIARWGDVLRPFEELKSLAIARYKISSRVRLEHNISESRMKLDILDSNVARYFDCQVNEYEVVGNTLF